MVRYTKLTGRKPEYSQSSTEERRKNAPVEHAAPAATNPAFAAIPASSSKSKKPQSPTDAEAEKLLKKAKLIRLKWKKAKDEDKKAALLDQVRQLERQARSLQGSGNNAGPSSSASTTPARPMPAFTRTLASEGITNPWKAMEAERRAVTSERSAHRREKRQAEREASTRCFACRQWGHTAKDCPEATAIDNTATVSKAAGDTASLLAPPKGTVCCYRCGSTQHALAQCRRPTPAKGPALPFAHCFVCSQVGHIARDCPQNAGKGIYPDGGQCKLCGSVQHLAKHCPLHETQRSQGTTAASTAVMGLARDQDQHAATGADEDDFHAFSRQRVQEEGGEGERKAKRAKAAASTARSKPQSKVVSF